MKRTNMRRLAMLVAVGVLAAVAATQNVLAKPPPPGSCPNDCNQNNIPDECDLACSGWAYGCPLPAPLYPCNYFFPNCQTSVDCNEDTVPDDCQLTGNDCNGDFIPDDCQLTANDCNGDAVPDDCQLTGNDCNGDSVPDDCQLTDNDCNGDSVPDDCQLTGNDCNTNLIPDDCEDCNANLLADECDIAAGTSTDCDNDGEPDECEDDCDGDGIADICQAPNGTLFVDTSAALGGNGRTWCTAFQELQGALSAAVFGDEIWIAGGTYRPTDNLSDPAASFVLKDGVALYGGFQGSESCDNPADCEASKNGRILLCLYGDYPGKPCDGPEDCPNGGFCPNPTPTILSGDLAQNDGTTSITETACPDCGGVWDAGECKINGEAIGNICENSHHVVTYNSLAGASVILDGVTIRDGYAHGATQIDQQGSGLQIRDSSQCLPGGPTVRNCIFDNNRAKDHAAVNDHALSSSFTNCVFQNNRAPKGAGLLVDNGSPTIADCLFLHNTTSADPHEGGGAWFGIRDSDPDPDCTGTSSPTVTASLFVGNIAMEGGGIWSKGADLSITYTDFIENTADGGWTPGNNNIIINGMGGALFLEDAGVSANANVSTCKFQRNDAEDAGGGMFIRNSVCHEEGDCIGVTVVDCIFEDNATFRGREGWKSTYPNLYSGGGAIWNEGSPATIRDCLFDHNKASSFTQYGGAIFNMSSYKLALENCRFHGNLAGYVGGAVYEQNSTSTHTNCEYVGNAAFLNPNGIGSAIVILPGRPLQDPGSSDITLINCTITENEVTSSLIGPNDPSSAVYMSGPFSTLTVTNCVLWKNRNTFNGDDGENNQIVVVNGASADVTYSIWGGYTVQGDTNSSDDPEFTVAPCGGTDGWVDDPRTPEDEGKNDNFPETLETELCENGNGTKFDVTLKVTSPCIDAGDNTPLVGVVYDLADNPRLVDDPNRADTGNTTSGCPLTDQGAYEVQATGPACCGCGANQVCCISTCHDGDCCVDADCDSGETCGGGSVAYECG